MEVCDESLEQIRISVSPEPVDLSETKDSGDEVARIINQATLGRSLRRETLWRCKRQFGITVDSSDGNSHTEGIPMTTSMDGYPKELQKHEERWVTKLTGVTILPSVGETGLGILEAHVNGFTYSEHGRDDLIVIMHDNIVWSLYALGNKLQPPLMQFHLKHPIKSRDSEIKDIQIRVLPASRHRDDILKDFIREVQEIQWTCKSELPFTPVIFHSLDEFQFDATFPTGEPIMCALTRYALVLLKEPPYSVVSLREIKIVNLACVEPDGIEMTVVFEDLERDVLQLRSIPLKFLTDIKHRLNSKDIKYYVNNLRPNWSDILREIRESPEVFRAKGGWDIFEDSLTLANYPPVNPHSYLDSFFESPEEEDVFY